MKLIDLGAAWVHKLLGQDVVDPTPDPRPPTPGEADCTAHRRECGMWVSIRGETFVFTFLPERVGELANYIRRMVDREDLHLTPVDAAVMAYFARQLLVYQPSTPLGVSLLLQICEPGIKGVLLLR